MDNTGSVCGAQTLITDKSGEFVSVCECVSVCVCVCVP